MQAKILLWLLAFCCVVSVTHAQLYVSGADLCIKPKALVFVDSNVVYAGNQQQAIDHYGSLEMTGNWYNLSATDNKVFTDVSVGTVIMSGALQTFNGTNTRFPNLTLAGSNKKQMFTAIEIKDTLTLANTELDVNGNTVTILSNDPGAIVYNTNGNGYVNTATSKDGWLVRNVQRGVRYMYPLGDKHGSLLHFRPLAITAQEQSNIYAQFQDYDPSMDQLYPTSTDGSIQAVNKYWYHAIKTDVAGNAANVSIFYNAAQDGNYNSMAGWNAASKDWSSITAASRPSAGSALVDMEMYTTSLVPVAVSGNSPIGLAKSNQADIFIPNVITPNGDGKNDRLIIKGADPAAAIDIIIFNRWGNLVYHSANYNNSWDASGLNAGTYFYEIKIKNTSGSVMQYKGNILVMK